MKIAIIADEELKEEWLAQGVREAVEVEWISQPSKVEQADSYIDLLFVPTPERILKLQELQPALVIINSVATTLKNLPENFIRINGWPTFLNRPVVESSCHNETLKPNAERIFNAFNKTPEWVTDIAGFITPRVISMIINEAYYALDEKVSTKKEIDTAMQLGTNYPFGPFDWGEKIGLMNVYELLTALAKTNSRYEPADLLRTEASIS